tara:strand:+ start:22673 stop:23218 length:546 start_codon:yes stop_codon:yes gene_type:complete
MKCHNCSATAKYKFTDKRLCARCFCKVVEKRLRKYLRLSKCITKGDKVYVDSDVCKYFIDKIITFPITKVKVGKKGTTIKEITKKVDKMVIPWTLDHECMLFLDKFSGKGFDLKMLESDKKIVKLFLTIDEASLIDFCKINKIKYDKIKNNKVKNKIDKLVEKYPEIKYSLGKSIGVLKNI